MKIACYSAYGCTWAAIQENEGYAAQKFLAKKLFDSKRNLMLL